MTITVGITHITHYKYDRAVSLSPHSIRLRPSPHNKVPIRSYSFKVKPKDHFLNWYQDIYGNHVANIVINDRVSEFYMEVDLKAEIRIINPFDFFLDKKYEKFPFQYDHTTKEELNNYLTINHSEPKLLEWIKKNIDLSKPQGTIDFIVDVNRKMSQAVDYIIRMEPGVYTPDELLTNGKGSCRDMAWMLVQAFRHCGIAARFVSGYLVQLSMDMKEVEGPSGVENDVVDLHAWCEIYIPGAGWIGLDPTSGLLASEGHIPLSCSPMPYQSAPVMGALDYCETTFNHKMKVKRIHEDPRVTKPFSDGEWQNINKLAKKIDKQIRENDLRLTMGGEPTFISTLNRDAPEWTTAALGDEKWKKAVELLFRLRKNFAPEGSLHFGQGKWYGGESLPRWALGCFYRKDGEPVWKNSELIAENKNYPKNKGTKPEDAEKFITELGRALGIAQKAVIPAYEDVPYNLLRERILPIEGEIIENAAKDDEVKRLLQLDKKELGKPKGYVLPLIYSISRKKWISNLWKFRSDYLLLFPGDSPVGYRLPLGSLPYVKEGEKEIPPARSNFEKLPSLPEYKNISDKIKKNLTEEPSKKTNEYLDKDKVGYVRTAICGEVRKGRLHLFLPPISYAEHYLELIVAIEKTAEKLSIPVQLEGYAPPYDPRMGSFYITPDPGVIEVNVQPAKTWDELKEINETVFEEARQIKLTAEKFMTDGKRTGTGGGNHIIAGGATPDDSPFLRRPDLLKSIITYWQNHPGLSYFFSGVFIGPTSQAPRIDEARNDSLYELEIALNQIDRKKKTPLWMVDRLLRNILVDVTGNTHRSEICIDKLYSPEGERGRLGLVEFRGFEMTPHPRMNLLQILLLRAIITKFWNEPYEGKLIPWGNILHDKFMLPQYVWENFKKVLKDLREYGFDFKEDWFMPQHDFRFPIYGLTNIEGIELELRSALEPWPVLGEENVAGATSRGVDSALERLQVKVKGMDDQRFKLACNKFEVELQETEEKDIKVAGIKFKAWNPVSTLHPNLPINSPLTFDIIDTYNNFSIGGCRYHVFHPGGRNYDTAPVNVNEAEGRMISRFEDIGHSKGKVKLKTIERHSEFPFTLDLRRGS